MFESFTEDGNEVERRVVKISRYLTERAVPGVAMIGQPAPQMYFDRALTTHFTTLFRAGFMVDGLHEPSFDGTGTSTRPTFVGLLRRDSPRAGGAGETHGLISSVVAPFLIVYGISDVFIGFGPKTTAFIHPAEIFPDRCGTTGYGIPTAVEELGAVAGVLTFPRAVHWAPARER